MAPAGEGLSLGATLQRHPDKMACPFLQTGVFPPPPLDCNLEEKGAEPLLDSWVPQPWYLPAGAQAQGTQAAKGTYPSPQPTNTLLRSLQAGAPWFRWKGNGRPSPYFPTVQEQGIVHTERMGAVEWQAIVLDKACRWLTVTAPHPPQTQRSPP